MVRERRLFSEEFKREAVKLVGQPGASKAGIARDLGIGANLLGRWCREANVDGHAGNPISSIPLNANGQAIVEIKTGNGPMTGNQTTVYPAAQTGNATGVGKNAGDANTLGTISPTPVVILRKL